MTSNDKNPNGGTFKQFEHTMRVTNKVPTNNRQQGNENSLHTTNDKKKTPTAPKPIISTHRKPPPWQRCATTTRIPAPNGHAKGPNSARLQLFSPKPVLSVRLNVAQQEPFPKKREVRHQSGKNLLEKHAAQEPIDRWNDKMMDSDLSEEQHAKIGAMCASRSFRACNEQKDSPSDFMQTRKIVMSASLTIATTLASDPNLSRRRVHHCVPVAAPLTHTVFPTAARGAPSVIKTHDSGIQTHRCGCLEPGDFPGNYSFIWADTTFESALGHDPPHPTVPSARRLQLQDAKTTERHLDLHEKDVNKLRLRERQFQLEASTSHGVPLTPHQKHEAEAIDALKTKAMHRADERCRKPKAGAVALSDATNEAVKKIDFWTCALRRRRGTSVRPKLSGWHLPQFTGHTNA